MQFTISDVARAAGARHGLLSADAAAFLMLSVSEDPSLALCTPDPDSLQIGPGGSVAHGVLRVAQGPQVDSSLRHLLGQLLARAAGSSAPLESVVRGSGASLNDFRRDLLTALVPFNRAAAQRALLRLHRRISELAQEVDLRQLDLGGFGLENRAANPAARPDVANNSALQPPPSQSASPQAVPAPRTSWAGFPVHETPESVTPYLGSLELEERPLGVYSQAASDDSAQNANWDDDLLGLTDPVARVAWETDGAPAIESRSDAGETHTVAPDAVVGADPDFDDLDTFETARLWPLPASELRGLIALNQPLPQPASLAPATVEPARAPYLSQYRPEVPSASKLLLDYASTPSPPLQDVKQVLRRFVADASEASPSHTPPPVAAQGEDVEALDAPRAAARSSRYLTALSSAALLGGAVVGATLYARAEAQTTRHVATAQGALTPMPPAVLPAVAMLGAERSQAELGAEPECVAALRVETESRARVLVISGETRQSAQGPHALFERVPCSDDARVLVDLAGAQDGQDEGVNAEHEWLQTPLPESSLRAASGKEPLLIRAFKRVL